MPGHKDKARCRTVPICCCLFQNRKKESQVRSSMFAGLLTVFSCSILIISTFPAHTFGWAFFLSRSAVAGLWGFALIVDAPLLIFAGRFLERYGQTVTLLFASPLFACFVCLASTINSWIGLLGSFFVLRFLGAGVMFLLSNTTLAKWFKIHRGKAALVTVIASFVMLIVQAPVHYLIAMYGWRMHS